MYFLYTKAFHVVFLQFATFVCTYNMSVSLSIIRITGHHFPYGGHRLPEYLGVFSESVRGLPQERYNSTQLHEYHCDDSPVETILRSPTSGGGVSRSEQK